MNKKYWVLIMNNFNGEDEVIYFENYEIANENFKAICKRYEKYDEFSIGEDFCEWFDPNYNEYSTYVYLREKKLPKIYNKILF